MEIFENKFDIIIKNINDCTDYFLLRDFECCSSCGNSHIDEEHEKRYPELNKKLYAFYPEETKNLISRKISNGAMSFYIFYGFFDQNLSKNDVLKFINLLNQYGNSLGFKFYWNDNFNKTISVFYVDSNE